MSLPGEIMLCHTVRKILLVMSKKLIYQLIQQQTNIIFR